MSDRPYRLGNRALALVTVPIGTVLIALAVQGLVPALLAHEVHTPGGRPVSVVHYETPISLSVRLAAPSQSVSDITCFNAPQGAGPCSQWIPGLHQAPRTLYYVWPSGCYTIPAPGPFIRYQGFNLEYFALTRTLVIHCYAGTGWIHMQSGIWGIASVTYLLLAISTSGMDAGPLLIREDDRLEHLIGEQSTEYDLTTTTIS